MVYPDNLLVFRHALHRPLHRGRGGGHIHLLRALRRCTRRLERHPQRPRAHCHGVYHPGRHLPQHRLPLRYVVAFFADEVVAGLCLSLSSDPSGPIPLPIYRFPYYFSGSSWSAGTPRRLTSCAGAWLRVTLPPPSPSDWHGLSCAQDPSTARLADPRPRTLGAGTCPDSTWNGNSSVGSETYGNGRRQVNTDVPVDDELRFSSFSSDQNQVRWHTGHALPPGLELTALVCGYVRDRASTCRCRRATMRTGQAARASSPSTTSNTAASGFYPAAMVCSRGEEWGLRVDSRVHHIVLRRTAGSITKLELVPPRLMSMVRSQARLSTTSRRRS